VRQRYSKPKVGRFLRHGVCTVSLRNIVSDYVSKGNTVNLCAIDLSKAFDKVNHNALYIKMMKRFIPFPLLDYNKLILWLFHMRQMGLCIFNFLGLSFVKRFALCYQTVALSVLSCLSVKLVYCGQTVGWIKMPLGREIGLDPGDIVLDGDPAPPSPPKGGGTADLTFRPMSIVVKLLDGSRWNLTCRQASAWPHCVRWEPSCPSSKVVQHPTFGPYLLWPNGSMD